MDEIRQQVAAQAGPIVEDMNRATEAFARRTENVEFVTALGLSDFYFGPDTETTISFEMRRDFRPRSDATYEEITQNIESATHVDCAVTDGTRSLNFQIKRYPQAYLEHSNDAFLSWLDEDVIAGYGEMNGTILIVLLQPTQPPGPTAFRFTPLSEAIAARADNITFDEIALSYTDIARGRQLAVLHRMYPVHRRTVAPLEWMMMRFRGQA